MTMSPDYFTAPDDAETLSMLGDRLGLAAEAEGLLDVAYTTIDSPVGVLLLAATPQGLVRVAYAVEDHDRVLDTLSRAHQPARAASATPAGLRGTRTGRVFRRAASRLRRAA